METISDFFQRSHLSVTFLPHHKGKLVHCGLDGRELVLESGGQTCRLGEGRRLDTIWVWHLNQGPESTAAVDPKHSRHQVTKVNILRVSENLKSS